MALTPVTPTIQLVATDKKGKESRKFLEANVSHPDMADLATIIGVAGVANLDAVAALYQAVTDLSVVKVRVVQDYDWDGATPATAFRQDRTIVNGKKVDGDTATMYIPGAKASIFINDGAAGPQSDIVDSGDVDLIAWLELFSETVLNDVTDPTGVFLVSDGEQLADPLEVSGYYRR